MSPDVILNLFQDVIMLLIFIGTLRQLIRGKRSLRMTFFAFAMASGLLSNLYWLTYDILRPETRMPFAANEIGEWAMFLLLGTTLGTRPIKRAATMEKIFVLAFMAANVALWIAWSGEWIEDIITGAALGYFICQLTLQCRQEEAFRKWEWRLYVIACMIILASQTAIFFVSDPLKHPLDLFCYFLMFAVAVTLFVRAVWSFWRADKPAAGVCRSFAAGAWMLIVMYMSAGVFYAVANIFMTLCMVLWFLTLVKEDSI